MVVCPDTWKVLDTVLGGRVKVAHLVEHWTGSPKITGSYPAPAWPFQPLSPIQSKRDRAFEILKGKRKKDALLAFTLSSEVRRTQGDGENLFVTRSLC